MWDTASGGLDANNTRSEGRANTAGRLTDRIDLNMGWATDEL